MSWFKLFIACVVLYLGQSYYLLSANNVEKFLAEHNALAMQDPVAACDNYSDDVKVFINHDTGNGNGNGAWEVEGGKNEICGYIKQSQAALTVLQANTSGHFENLTVKTGLPWSKAHVSYDEINDVQMNTLGSIISKTHDVIAVKRTLTGLSIDSVNSTGGVNSLGKP